MKYKVEVRWFHNGDHPLDKRDTFRDSYGIPFLGEGKIVKYFRHPDFDGCSIHDCGHTFHNHGYIDSTETHAGSIVCPGNVIILCQSDGNTPSYHRITVNFREYLNDVVGAINRAELELYS